MNTSWDFYKDPDCSIKDLDKKKIHDLKKLLESRKGKKITENDEKLLQKFELIRNQIDVTFACSLLFKKHIPLATTITLARFQ